MHTNSSLLFLHTLTSTHAGSGTELSYIDLPIQRETHTGFPKIEASTLKGCLRPLLTDQDPLMEQILGNPNRGDYAAAVAFTDARLLFFPVKSVCGVFAWITCPLVLRRFQKDLQQFTDSSLSMSTWQPNDAEALTTNTSKLLVSSNKNDKKIMLEDYLFEAKVDDTFTTFITDIFLHCPFSDDLQKHFTSHVVLLSDNDFAYFVKYATEVNTRIKIDPQTGTVDGTALFTEEFLPPETILYSLIFYNDAYQTQDTAASTPLNATAVKEKFLQQLQNVPIFQIGADRSLGKGLVEYHLWKANKK